jgi:phosphatidylinositol alpha-1,6-mannosyltransferase
MRVLLLTTEVGGGGGVQYAGRLMARALQECHDGQNEVTLVTVKDAPDDLKRETGNGADFGGGGSRLRTAVAGWRLLARDSWDLLVLGHLNLAALALAVARDRLPPSLAFIHGLEAWRQVRGLRRRGLARIDKILYVSGHTRDRSQAANPWLTRVRSAICPWGLLPREAPSQLASASNGFHPVVSPEGSFALSVGRMARSESYKGHEELIRIWPAVQRVRPGLRLVLIGEGDGRPRLERIAHDLSADVEFLGRVDDAVRNAYLEACRCFCLPSRGEGLGLVYLEAMRAGKPVLAGSGDAGREVVMDGVTGRTVDPTNPVELLQGVLDVSGDKATKMGQAGYQRFQEHFRYERFLDRLTEHVRSVCCAKSVVSL